MSLPSELLLAILIHLDFRNVLRCREVCTTFKALIDNDVRTQYKLELAVAGMEDSPSSSLTPIERLSVLRAHQDAWHRFAWTAKVNIPMRQGHIWQLHGNVVAQLEGTRTLYFKRISSAIRQIEGSEWVITDVGCDITASEIGMDPAQDLLVVTERIQDGSDFTCCIHLRALSTGAPHPAVLGEAMLMHKSKTDHFGYSTQTSGDYLGIRMCERGNCKELLIFEWKTGTLCLHVTGPEIEAWTFLSSKLLLIAKADSEYNEEERHIALVIVDLEAQRPSNVAVALSEVDYVCAFHYPPLENHISSLRIDIQSEPGLTSALSRPFSVSSEHRVFLISLWVTGRPHPEDSAMRHLVPMATFVRALGTLAPGQRRRDFEWNEWGPYGSRLFWTPEAAEAWMETSYAYGTVFVTAENVWGTSRMVVTVRDFNQLAIRRRAAGSGEGRKDSGSNERQNVRVVEAATVLEPDWVFKEEITTSLPYAERVLDLFRDDDDLQIDGVILTEDALVLATVGWQSRYRCRILSI